MMLALAFILAAYLLGFLVSRKPSAFARFALIPVGEPVTLQVPPKVIPLIFPPQEPATYREAPERGLVLASLAGEARTERDNRVIHFVFTSNQVLAQPRGLDGRLVRVEIAAGAGTLILRARRVPIEVLSIPILVLWFTRVLGSPTVHLGSTPVLALSILGFLAVSHRAGRKSFDAVVAEMRARLAIANGDPPPTNEPAAPMLATDEWACACGKVNKRKKTMCGRCWAQRAGSP